MPLSKTFDLCCVFFFQLAEGVTVTSVRTRSQLAASNVEKESEISYISTSIFLVHSYIITFRSVLPDFRENTFVKIVLKHFFTIFNCSLFSKQETQNQQLCPLTR